MCGFAGYYGAGDFNREEVIDQMGERIAHRGPDSKGSFVDDYVALGFRRLSIIDLEGGSQPIHSADGKHVIIFNGEIYNYQEIRKELIEKHGCQFQTNSDTEVILQGYKTYGEKIASMLRGMFAFVIYDKETHNLFGARDYFGIKPFYYAQMNGSLLFGSEIKSFLAHPHFHKEVNIADVEVGSFLSGGVDSSYIASTVKPMKTYSVGFEVGGFDETTFSKDLCDILHMSNAKKEISSDEFFDALPEVQYHSDEPHANLSAVPLYYLSQLAAKDVKVVLSGEGADEMFGGYETYIPSKSGDMYRKIVPASIRKKLGDWAKHQPDKRGLNFLKRNATSVEDSYIGQAFIMDNEEADEVLSPAYKSKMRYQDVTKPYFDQVKDQDDLHKKLFLDMHLWLPHDILLKADKMTMAHSLELRVPYLDKKVWELARSIDSKYCVDGMETKKAFRTSALSHIPMDWAKRKKLGFLVPFRVWLREDKYYNKVKEMFQKDFVSEFFNQELLLKWLEDHKNKVGKYHRKIYTVYSFLLWYEQYFVLR